MTNAKKVGKRLVSSVMAIIVCLALLMGATFAWFTDGESSDGNLIKSGVLNVTASWAEGTSDPASASWTSFEDGAIFKHENWEPGYTVARHVRIANEGSLALKYQVDIVPNSAVSELADVIDVYFVNPAVQVSNRAQIESEYFVGTLADLIAENDGAAHGVLLPEGLVASNANEVVGSVSGTIVLKMQESAGDKYQGTYLCTDFSIVVIATQYTYEQDDFGADFDENAEYKVPVSTAGALFSAIDKGEDVLLTSPLTVDSAMTSLMKARSGVSTFALAEDTEVITKDAYIDGNGITIYRSKELADKPIFQVADGYSLTLENITLDGGAVWGGDIDPTLCRGTVNKGMTTTGSIIALGKNSHVTLEEGAIVQNNDGQVAIHPNTRVGSTITVNGGEIINNHSAAGAIWGGGEITLNAGKISYNHGGIGGAIRAVTNIGTLLTMNGGEMNHNKSDDVGGAIWAGTSRSNNVYVLNGGEMAYNYSCKTGGAMYPGYYETVKIGGTFKMHDNDCAEDLGKAIRFYTYSSFYMTGGEIYNNGNKGNSIFLNNNTASITGGKIVDNFGYNGGLGLTWGNGQVDGVITYNLATNHNTAYLAKEFSTLKFSVNENNANFVNFNFKPASDYVYVEGDEDKLVCMNEGYETYWDATTKTFRLAQSK